jgi:hypothetical protein
MTKEEEGRRTQPGVSVRREKGALIQWEEDIRTKCKAALDAAFTNAPIGSGLMIIPTIVATKIAKRCQALG